MAVKLQVRYSFFALALGVSALVYIVSSAFIVSSDRAALLHEAYTQMRGSADQAAQGIAASLQEELAVVETLAASFSQRGELTPAQWRPLFVRQMERVFEDHHGRISNLWECAELSSFVEGYDKPYGREFWQVVMGDSGRTVVSTRMLNLSGDSKLYGEFKERNRAELFEPYRDVVSTGGQRNVLMTTLAAPIQIDGEFVGMVGADLPLTWLDDYIREVEAYPVVQAFLVSQGGMVAAHTQDSMVAAPIEKLFGRVVASENLREAIARGQGKTFMYVDQEGERFMVHLVPIRVGRHSRWAMGVIAPQSAITSTADRSYRMALGAMSLALLLLALGLYFASGYVAGPIGRLASSLDGLRRGHLDDALLLEPGARFDDLGQLSAAFNEVLRREQAMRQFVDGAGRADYSPELPVRGQRDELAIALHTMRDTLREERARQQDQAEEAQRKAWVNTGIKGLGSLLRKHNRSVEDLAAIMLPRLVRYMDAAQGALYLRDEELFAAKGVAEFYLVEAFAWDRKRYLSARFELGVGSVGSCAMERKPLLMTDLPDGYSRVLAGVGQSQPRSVVLMPLLHGGVPIAVLEIATMHRVEPYQIDFLKAVAVSMASSLASLEARRRNGQLLAQAHQQTEELRGQLQEMERTVEQLRASGQMCEREQADVVNLLASLSGSLPYVVYGPEGYPVEASRAYHALMGTRPEDLSRVHFTEAMRQPGWGRADLDELWANLWKPQAPGQRLVVEREVRGERLRLVEFFVPIQGPEGNILRLMRFLTET